MSVRHLLAILSLAFTTAAVANEEHISYSYTTAKGGIEVLEAVVTLPSNNGKKPAVVILHHSGGWDAGTTKQYADLLAKNGFIFLLFFNAQACSAWPVKQCSFSKKKIHSSGHKSTAFPSILSTQVTGKTN